MDFLNKLRNYCRKKQKTIGILALIFLFVFFVIYPDYIGFIPIVSELFIDANSLHGYLVSYMYQMVDLPFMDILVDIYNTIIRGGAFLFTALWLVFVIIRVFVGIIEKAREKFKALSEKINKKKAQQKADKEARSLLHEIRQLTKTPQQSAQPVNLEKKVAKKMMGMKKNKVKKPVKYMFGSAVAMTPLQKIRAMYELKELKEQCEMVFFENKNTYIRIQRMVATDSMNEKKESLLEWGINKRITIPFTVNDQDAKLLLYLENNSAKFKIEMGGDVAEAAMTLNTPIGIAFADEMGRSVLLFVVTWIGDEERC